MGFGSVFFAGKARKKNTTPHFIEKILIFEIKKLKIKNSFVVSGLSSRVC